MTEKRIHPFEEAGLGKAPFHFDGVTENVYTTGNGAHSQPGGCCKYCFHGIRYEFWVVSADGERFPVGCDCIRKISSKGSKMLSEAEKAQKELKRQKAEEKLQTRIKSAKAILDSDSNLLADMPHPSEWRKEDSLRDYVNWMFENAGNSGMTRACRIIENATR